MELTLIVLSSDAVNKDLPSLAKSTHRTDAVCALKTVDSPFLQHKSSRNMNRPSSLPNHSSVYRAGMVNTVFSDPWPEDGMDFYLEFLLGVGAFISY